MLGGRSALNGIQPYPLLWPRLKELLKFIFSVGIAALKTNDYYFGFEITEEEEGRERTIVSRSQLTYGAERELLESRTNSARGAKG